MNGKSTEIVLDHVRAMVRGAIPEHGSVTAEELAAILPLPAEVLDIILRDLGEDIDVIHVSPTERRYQRNVPDEPCILDYAGYTFDYATRDGARFAARIGVEAHRRAELLSGRARPPSTRRGP